MKKSLIWWTIALSVLCMGRASGQELSISANVADCLNMGTLSMGASYGFSKHWSVQAVGKYNPFTWEMDGAAAGQVRNRQRLLGAGVRYWPWHIYSGFWLESRAQWQEYSISPYREEYAEEGDRIGDAISAGYSYMVSRHLNIDFGLGFWMGYGTVTRYACPRCGRIVSSSADCFVKPSELVLSVSYVF